MLASSHTASEVVDALGVAWTIHGLYPDPENQPAFGRAVQDVAATEGEPFSVDVGPGSFVIDGEELHTERQAAERLAIRMFLHNVEVLRFSESPSERDVVKLFNILAREPESVLASGGVTGALARDGVTAFTVMQRADLGDLGDGPEVDRDDRVAEVMADGGDPETFAAGLLDGLSGDPLVAAKAIRETYHDVLGRVASEDVAGREEVVQAFVEAFFFMPEAVQVSLVEAFLSNHSNQADRAFLDQFAGHELARMSTRLDTQAMSLLMDYANVVTDPEADARSDELLALIAEAPDAVESARQLIASHMADKWGDLVESSHPSAEASYFTMPEDVRHFYTVLEVFRDLLVVEDREERFGRLMRIWSGKVLAAVRAGEFRRAELWMRAVRDNPTFSDGRSAAVGAAVDSVAGPGFIEQLVRYYRALGEPAPVLRLMRLTGARLVDPLVEALADSDDAAARRALTELVGHLAEADPAPVIGHLSDERWYLVRNLAVALRRSGHPEVVAPLGELLGHDDARVRVEAVRGIAVLGDDEALAMLVTALADDEHTVRTAAIAALGTKTGPDAEQALIEALDSSRLTPDQRRKAIELLGRDPTPEAQDLLRRIAGRRFAFTAAARLMRDTARRVLKAEQAGER